MLYVLDADMLFELTAGTADLLAWRREIPELIVIGISYGGSRKDWWAKRSRDMTPTPDRSKVCVYSTKLAEPIVAVASTPGFCG